MTNRPSLHADAEPKGGFLLLVFLGALFASEGIYVDAVDVCAGQRLVGKTGASSGGQMMHDSGEPVTFCFGALDSMNGTRTHDAAIRIGIGTGIGAFYHAVLDIHFDSDTWFAIEKLCLASLGSRVHPQC